MMLCCLLGRRGFAGRVKAAAMKQVLLLLPMAVTWICQAEARGAGTFHSQASSLPLTTLPGMGQPWGARQWLLGT